MKRIVVVAAAAVVLAACNPNAAKQREPAPDSSLSLTCERFANISNDALEEAYGAENVVEQTLPGVEGDSYVATIVYPNDPTRRIEIVWRDNATKNAPASVIVDTAGSLWVGANNLSIGDGLADVERANGQPFELWGFGWDYGGWVSDWKAGSFATANGCNVRARFMPRSAANASAMGDSAFMSDNPAVRAADATVSEFGLMFSTPE
jgi:hypothetical protein